MLALAAFAAFLGSAAEAAAFNWLALGPWRRSAGQHWTERARLLYPGRRSMARNFGLFPLGIMLAAAAGLPDIYAPVLFTSALLGVILGCYPANREFPPAVGFWPWLHLVAGSWVAWLSIWLAYMLCIFLMPMDYGLGTWLGIILFFTISAAFLRGFPLRLLRALRLLHPAPKHLQNLVSATADKMRQPVRAVWVLTSLSANAMVFPVIGELVFTSVLVSRFSDEEIQAICAHELGHLGERRWVLFGRIVVSLAGFPLIFLLPVLNHFDGQTGGSLTLVALLSAPFIIILLGRVLSRRMEKRADKIAADFTPDPALYAHTLARIYEINRVPAVMPRRSAKVHPDLYDRMTAAGVTPDFPKPPPAKRFMWTDLLILFYLLVVGFLAIPVLASQ